MSGQFFRALSRLPQSKAFFFVPFCRILQSAGDTEPYFPKGQTPLLGSPGPVLRQTSEIYHQKQRYLRNRRMMCRIKHRVDGSVLW